MMRDNIARAIKTGKQAIPTPEKRGEWVTHSLNEIILGLELAAYTLEHIDDIIIEEEELKALRPLIREFLTNEGYEPCERLVGQVLKHLEGYWDKFDRQAWEAALVDLE